MGDRTRVIGLTGLPGSGKGEVAAAVLAWAGDHGLRSGHLSFSDEIKIEIRRRGIPEEKIDRELLAKIGTELREKEGPGTLARRIAGRIRSDLSPRPDLVVVEALRHVGEVAELRESFGDDFTLIAVEAEPEEIVRRLKARARADESPEALASAERAARMLQRELAGDRSAMSPRVGACIREADHVFHNHGTLDDLRTAVRAFCEAAWEDGASG